MANQKHRNTPLEKLEQKKRTYKNKVRKAEKLLETYPNSPHRAKWKKDIEFFSVLPSK